MPRWIGHGKSPVVAEYQPIVAIAEPGKSGRTDAVRDEADRAIAQHKHASTGVRRTKVITRSAVGGVSNWRGIRMADRVPVPPSGIPLVVVRFVLRQVGGVESFLTDQDRIRRSVCDSRECDLVRCTWRVLDNGSITSATPCTQRSQSGRGRTCQQGCTSSRLGRGRRVRVETDKSKS